MKLRERDNILASIFSVRANEVEIGKTYQLMDGSKVIVLAETSGEHHLEDFHTSPTWVGFAFMDGKGKAHHIGWDVGVLRKDDNGITPFFYLEDDEDNELILP